MAGYNRWIGPIESPLDIVGWIEAKNSEIEGLRVAADSFLSGGLGRQFSSPQDINDRVNEVYGLALFIRQLTKNLEADTTSIEYTQFVSDEALVDKVRALFKEMDRNILALKAHQDAVRQVIAGLGQ